MLCDICQMREATIKFTQVINLKKKEMNICKECAEKKGFANPLLSLQKLFGGFLLLDQLVQPSEPALEKDIIKLRCKSCNLSWQDFQKNGLFGCKDCYDTFDEELKVILRRIHGSTKHIGNRPFNRRVVVDKKINLDELKKELKQAIKEEKFEKAAKLRDKIRDVEANFNRIEK